jgi:RimJ/RimL family protein N-acetyltransferase
MHRRFTFSRRLAVVGSVAVVLALALPLVFSAYVAASPPRADDFFEYEYNTFVDEGAGDYTGYTDSMHSQARYSVGSVVGDTVTLHGVGTWTFEGSDGTSQSGSTDVTPVFSLSTRQYLSGIDINSTILNPSVWFWIPSSVSVGKTIPVADEVLTVTSIAATVWLGAMPRSTVLLEGSGSYTRNDAYGVFAATYHDQYYFDRESGFIVSEQYTEQDTSFSASFRFRGEVYVRASSYPIPLDGVAFLLVYVGIPAAAVLAIAAVLRVRRGPSRLRIGSGDQAQYVRIRKAKDPAEVTGLVPDGSPFFGPFLPVFAERSIAEHDPVVLALDDRRIVGMALLDRESGIGSLFASEGSVARVLLKRLRMRDFFADGTLPGRILGAKEVDRFAILQLRNPQPMEYDTTVVRPMTADDLYLVTVIAQSVYGGRASRFIASSFQGGDLGFVATSGGRIVGFGFATVVGTVARLHTLTVSADQRAQGMGTEIMNARLSALAALGVDRVIVEISKANAASMRIATRVGFAPVGDSIYYSRHPEAAPTALQRQN